MDKVSKIWMDGELVDWDKANIHILTHTLHYGAGVFEGVRFYNTEKGPAVFRLAEHTKRLFKSASIFEMKVLFTEEQVNDAIIETIKVNKIDGGYIRPLIYFGSGVMGLNPDLAPVNVSVAIWGWGKYLGDEAVKVKVSDYIRLHPKSTQSDAKVTGHYFNSILANREAKAAGFDEALLLDYEGNVAEGPGENIFIINDKKIRTPPLGNILPGITRASVIELATDLGYEVTEEVLTVDDIKNADEAFFTGTAAEVSPIAQIEDTKIADGKMGPVTKELQKSFFEIVEGKNEKYEKWLTYIK